MLFKLVFVKDSCSVDKNICFCFFINNYKTVRNIHYLLLIGLLIDLLVWWLIYWFVDWFISLFFDYWFVDYLISMLFLLEAVFVLLLFVLLLEALLALSLESGPLWGPPVLYANYRVVVWFLFVLVISYVFYTTNNFQKGDL